MICRASARSGARISSPLISYHVIDHEGEMACTSDQHQHVPDLVVAKETGVGVRPSAGVYHRPNGVGDAAGYQPQQAAEMHGPGQGDHRNHGEVAHQEIAPGREPHGGIEIKKLEGNTGQGDQPDGGEKNPAETAVEGNEGNRCVGAGYEKVDRDMIECAEGSKRPLRQVKRVVERTRSVEQNQGGTVDGKGYQLLG